MALTGQLWYGDTHLIDADPDLAVGNNAVEGLQTELRDNGHRLLLSLTSSFRENSPMREHFVTLRSSDPYLASSALRVARRTYGRSTVVWDSS